mmetsp:Transcript_14228/g.21667  ORF Transcript_14228/g.21667 Transcript_14228/m.21667 type:complete len:97 (+) Transcript_14228:519-809(+)
MSIKLDGRIASNQAKIGSYICLTIDQNTQQPEANGSTIVPRRAHPKLPQQQQQSSVGENHSKRPYPSCCDLAQSQIKKCCWERPLHTHPRATHTTL